ncbi:hypothetical protein HN419_06120 [Candidatus Woesearchaeota archaeon]|jgi:hypothetical protein|nr:hypothetical protein [Candidatus Woesearchaeota archaeon]MBT3537555.1 hypothetical protein [Candidatus Woesearchaeota archaeon]MBT4698385.1 hypothetical protein [Candidatus Woesearchaeota archaeon]MBT4716543.1 hypothetical protein [Candidatus Woesearchaeota archaeon]MBT7105223.1 hypothetical protein [Candidatus Woesearchaeota archaeon]
MLYQHAIAQDASMNASNLEARASESHHKAPAQETNQYLDQYAALVAKGNSRAESYYKVNKTEIDDAIAEVDKELDTLLTIEGSETRRQTKRKDALTKRYASLFALDTYEHLLRTNEAKAQKFYTKNGRRVENKLQELSRRIDTLTREGSIDDAEQAIGLKKRYLHIKTQKENLNLSKSQIDVDSILVDPVANVYETLLRNGNQTVADALMEKYETHLKPIVAEIEARVEMVRALSGAYLHTLGEPEIEIQPADVESIDDSARILREETENRRPVSDRYEPVEHTVAQLPFEEVPVDNPNAGIPIIPDDEALEDSRTGDTIPGMPAVRIPIAASGETDVPDLPQGPFQATGTVPYGDAIERLKAGETVEPAPTSVVATPEPKRKLRSYLPRWLGGTGRK